MEGILLIDKPKGMNSFKLVAILRRVTGVRKIGHAGTLDPLASGLMVLLVGKAFTRQADSFLSDEKEYEATLFLGGATPTYDAEAAVTETSEYIPTLDEIEQVLEGFQGEQLQIPPMYSAKQVGGKRLYDLARKGQVIERAAQKVRMEITLLSYSYPMLKLYVKCSKGTYIRTLAHDVGLKLGTFAYLSDLKRTRSGRFSLEGALQVEELKEGPLPFLQNG